MQIIIFFYFIQKHIKYSIRAFTPFPITGKQCTKVNYMHQTSWDNKHQTFSMNIWFILSTSPFCCGSSGTIKCWTTHSSRPFFYLSFSNLFSIRFSTIFSTPRSSRDLVLVHKNNPWKVIIKGDKPPLFFQLNILCGTPHMSVNIIPKHPWVRV